MNMHFSGAPEIRHDWTAEEARAIHDLPFNDLLLKAQLVHRAMFDPNAPAHDWLVEHDSGYGAP